MDFSVSVKDSILTRIVSQLGNLNVPMLLIRCVLTLNCKHCNVSIFYII